MKKEPILIVGEIFIDFTLIPNNESKMRLGGVVHAARALWATNTPYSMAVSCPSYLVEQVKSYVTRLNCIDFIQIAEVKHSPNVLIIKDVKETKDQGYENILNKEKKFQNLSLVKKLNEYSNVVIYPGSFDLIYITQKLNTNSVITIDISYDIENFSQLKILSKNLKYIAISTSSDLFKSNSLNQLLTSAKEVNASHLLLKENRGGSQLFDLTDNTSTKIPAVLSQQTKNSIGVGDAFTAVFATMKHSAIESAWRGMQVATEYAGTTFMDDFKTNVGRALRLDISTVQGLGGVSLPWLCRKDYPIYLAAPDFSYLSSKLKLKLNNIVDVLKYHNFVLRRPIKENGEAPKGTSKQKLWDFYVNDISLLKKCSAVLAIPLERDPGTLVEIGMAIELKKPVITYDPYRENENTMIICGSKVYSSDSDECLNGLFEALSLLHKK